MDFSVLEANFWDDKSEIEYLYLENVNIQDFSFLKYLPKLIAVSVISDDTHLGEIRENPIIDFVNNKQLEYFEINNMLLQSIPEFTNIPDTLSYVIICNNIYHESSYSNQYSIFKNTNAMLYLDKWLISEHQEVNDLPLALNSNYGVLSVLYKMN